ncbi:hypothetical protein N665_0600s0021 [Sinapis alba]|nr:hypothetical protein N665_0600s0021 [Sinapis alba]
MAMKSLSFFTVFLILFLAIFEVPEIEAANGCTVEFVGPFPFSDCFIMTRPVCERKCRSDNKAKSGKCRLRSGKGVESARCFCNFCV